MKKITLLNHKKLYLSLAVIIAAIIGIIWYNFFRYDQYGIPVGLVSYQFVHSRLEGTLYYPGAKVFSTYGHKEDTITYSGAIMTTKDSPEKIYQWYNTWLVDHGWYSDKSWGGYAGQISIKTYSKGKRERFKVAIDDPKQLNWTLGKQISSDMTIFEFYYAILPYKKN